MTRLTSQRWTRSMLVVCGIMASAGGIAGQGPARLASAPADLSSLLESTTRAVSPAVVQIFSTARLPNDGVVAGAADLVATQRASGSGVIVDPAGFIVTNAHVVRGAQRVRVAVPTAASGNSILTTRSQLVAGEIVGIDLETDLAIVKVQGRSFPTVAFADSDELSPGQLVLALGSPLGLNNSVSLGVVSAVARQLEPESSMIYVQTDASINPGSSGGPLVDLQGRLVGINTLIATQTGGHEGVGFAAPANIVRTVYEQIRKSGRVRRGDIGVRAQTVSAALASGLGLAPEHGVVLADVIPGGPAARAGLRPGDVVLTLDGKRMENGRQLQVNLYRKFVGDVVSLGIVRDGRALTVLVPIVDRHDPLIGSPPDPREHLVARLGVLGVTLDAAIAERLPATRVPSGVVVVSSVAGAVDARDGGLAPGDVIYALNRTPVQNLEGLRRLVDALKPGDAVVLQIERRGELMYVAFTVD